jgi:hypothetical protein
MAIASISGSSPVQQPVRTGMEPVKAVSNDLKSEKKSASAAIDQENEDKNKIKAREDNRNEQKLNDYKGVKEVDVKV